jgi:hypothetical protein
VSAMPARQRRRDKFCGECGARLSVVCSACGSANPATSHFCGDCGASLGPAAAPGVQCFHSCRRRPGAVGQAQSQYARLPQDQPKLIDGRFSAGPAGEGHLVVDLALNRTEQKSRARLVDALDDLQLHRPPAGGSSC